ncbi:Type I restriction-modification system, specificity subunit S [Olavius sp. associated proteobacterium Delta 1]|nr:Type I restriction-modification system, specificity subunit S [Olavius sp. associated proteobacterium Delta 1]
MGWEERIECNRKKKSSVGAEWDQKLPEDWAFSLIKRYFNVTLGKMLQSVQLNETETEEYYLRSANLRWEGVDITDVRRMWFAPLEKKKLALQYGDLLVSEGGDAGRTSFWKDELSNCYIQNAINRVRARKKDSTRFLYYWLYLIKSIGYIDAVVSRITIAHLTAEKLERIPFIAPPVHVQQHIVAYLDKTCAAIDKAIATKQKQLEILNDLRMSIIHKAVTRGLDDSVELKDSRVEWLGRNPKYWITTQLKLVSTLQSGITLGKTYGGKLIERPYLRVANVQDGYLELEQIKTIFLSESEAKRTELCKGDVLMTEGGDLDKLGRGHMWDGQIPNCLHQNHIFAIRCNIEKFLPEYLTIITSSGYGRAYFEATGKRTTNLASTNSTKIRSFRIPLPPMAEQTAIIENLLIMQKQSDKLQENLYTQISTLKQYRKSLIHECVTGKRRITEDDVQGQL